jgi:hypothetical protein
VLGVQAHETSVGFTALQAKFAGAVGGDGTDTIISPVPEWMSQSSQAVPPFGLTQYL